MRLLPALILAGTISSAHAAIVDTPQRGADIGQAMHLISAVAARKYGPAHRTR